MRFQQDLDQLTDGATGPRVYEEPYETSAGVTVIPVSKVSMTLGFTVTPIGVFVIHDGEATWHPVVDENRLKLLGVLGGLAAAIIATIAVLRRPPWPDLSPRGLAELNRHRSADRRS